MQNVSVFGSTITLRASVTFPNGFPLTMFADDADPFDIPQLQIADKGMGPNGHLIVWSKANPLIITTNIIPGSDDDNNMRVLFDANRIARGKTSAQDEITITVAYPQGATVTFTGGAITDGTPASSMASTGRQKTKSYVFAFENVTGG